MAGAALTRSDVHAAARLALDDPTLHLPHSAGGGMLGAVALKAPAGEPGAVVVVMRLTSSQLPEDSRLLSIESYSHTFGSLHNDTLAEAATGIRDRYLNNHVHYLSPADISDAVTGVSDRIQTAGANGLAEHLTPEYRINSYFTVGGYDTARPCCDDAEPMQPAPLVWPEYEPGRFDALDEWCCSSCGRSTQPEVWAEINIEPLDGHPSSYSVANMPHPDLAQSAVELVDSHWLQRHNTAVAYAHEQGVAIASHLRARDVAGCADVLGYLHADTLLTDAASASLQTVLDKLSGYLAVAPASAADTPYSPQWALDPHRRRVHCSYIDHLGHSHPSGYSIEAANETGVVLVSHFPSLQPATRGLQPARLQLSEPSLSAGAGLSLS